MKRKLQFSTHELFLPFCWQILRWQCQNLFHLSMVALQTGWQDFSTAWCSYQILRQSLISFSFEKLLSQVVTLTAIVKKIRSIVYIWNRVPKVILLNKLQMFKGAFFFYCELQPTSATSYSCDVTITFFLIAQQLHSPATQSPVQLTGLLGI